MDKRFFLSALFLAAALADASGQAILFDNTDYDYGIIPYNSPAEGKFEVTNTGERPLVINKVSSSCGCADVRWPQEPIPPGGKGSILVEYDAKLMGHFYRELTVYCNADPYVYTISVSGEVSNTKVDYSKTHPFRMGDILVDTDELLFDDVQMGGTYTKTIGVVNMGDEPYKPVLMLTPSYLSVKCEPAVLGHRQRGVMTVTLDGTKLKNMGLTQTSVYLSRFPGDKICDETNIEVSAFVLPDMSNVSEEEKANAPQYYVTATQWRPDYEKNKSSYKKTFEIGNAGKSPLNIEKVQISNRALAVSLKKTTIKPGETTKLKVRLNMRKYKRHRNLRIYIVTNDPNAPKSIITIKH